jgi:L-cysteine S-thiosulfotransferase
MTAGAASVNRCRRRMGVRVAFGRATVLAVVFVTSWVAGFAHADNPATAAALASRIIGDGIPEPLAAESGDPVRGRALIVARESANCVLCHPLPDRAVSFAGDLGPSLAGVGARLSAPQIRLRVADNMRLNPVTIMPSYFKVDGLDRVASQYRGKPILNAREIEDVVAYLATLR